MEKEGESGAPELVAPAHGLCANCNTPMHGPFCYACGQPKKGLIRHLSGLAADFLDSVLNFDSRTFRTLGPLLFKPGYLSTEYFAGRRVRYVTPLRLYFFLSVITFLVISLVTPPLKPAVIEIDGEETTITTAAGRDRIIEDVDHSLMLLPDAERAKVREALRAELEKEAADEAARLAAMTDAERAAEAEAEARQRKVDAEAAEQKKAAAKAAALEAERNTAAEDAKPRSVAPGIRQHEPGDDIDVSFNGKRWHKTENPLTFGWLPDSLNVALNEEIEEVIGKAKKLGDDPTPFIKELFSIAPQAMFLMLPVFALLLKIFYVFKRRLYMEHLIVALHSHSFISIAILLLVALTAVQDSTWAPSSVRGGAEVVAVLIGIWLPVYLFIMQKRVYRQGWIMTTIKFVMIGMLYSLLISFGLVATMLASLVFM